MSIKNNKFRIFVDGSCGDGICVAGYYMQSIFFNGGNHKQLKNLCVNNISNSCRIAGDNAVDAEIAAVKLGLETFYKIILTKSFMKDIPSRIKSDSIPIINYITKGVLTDKVTFTEEQIKKLDKLSIYYKSIKKQCSHFKLSYIPSKQNLAHKYALEQLRWERALLTQIGGNNDIKQ